MKSWVRLLEDLYDLTPRIPLKNFLNDLASNTRATCKVKQATDRTKEEGDRLVRALFCAFRTEFYKDVLQNVLVNRILEYDGLVLLLTQLLINNIQGQVQFVM